MAFGVTPVGFVRPRLPEIRVEITDALTARLRAIGFEGPIETRPDSITGLLIDTFAERETAQWEQTEAVYYAMYPGSASGAQLDRAVSFTGVTRLAATASSVREILYGAEGTVVPAGTQLRNRTTQTLWQVVADTTIGAGAVSDTTLRPVFPSASAYTITLDGVPYTVPPAGSLLAVLNAFVAALAGSGHDVSSNGAALRIVSQGVESFALQLSANVELVTMGTATRVTSLEQGEIIGAPGDISEVVTLVPGLVSVSNLEPASVGRGDETDAELRERYSTGVYALGAATLPAIRANLLARVPGIRYARVSENDTDFIDADGLLPHSIFAVVDGGLDADIAQTIFQYKGGGIDTNGTISVTVTDSEGGDHAIRFSRPEPIYIWLKISVTLLPSAEEVFPPDGFDQIARNVVALGNSLGVGQDVIWQRLLKAVHAVPGVAEAEILVGTSTDPTVEATNYAESNVTITSSQIAKFDLTRVDAS